MRKEAGYWLEWADWSSCSVTCGGGQQSRSRDCQPARYGGHDGCADGQGTESRLCNTNGCPVDGYWLEWSVWSLCNVTCGGGLQSRDRVCSPPQHGGRDCSSTDTDTETGYQELRQCGMTPCPENGTWQDWSEWTDCNATCGGGIQKRRRECIPPRHGGADCRGDGENNRTCNNIPCPVDGVWGEWSSWTGCDVTCGGGLQHRHRDCSFPLYGGAVCRGDEEVVQTCNEQSCPVDGSWQEWGVWSDCDVTCGGGIQSRSRVCTPPLYGGADCQGTETDTQNCNENFCPVDGRWAEWSVWSDCDVTCGGGIQTRARSCQPPLHGGDDCTGDSQQSQICNQQHCPEAGYWLEWADWGSCSVTCGGGQQTRSRDCQPARYGGHDGCADGQSAESRPCNTNGCPVNGTWNEWNAWTECDVTCGGGIRSRRRTCTPPLYGGADCRGHGEETLNCNEHPCPVNGQLKTWSEWAECDRTCGGGVQVRTRTCQPPLYGGLNCSGMSHDSKICNEQHCPVDGSWQEWAPWADCDVTCGGGTQVRRRVCTPPLHGGADCRGNETGTRACNEQFCPVDGRWAEWSEWAGCDVTCGGGIQVRRRACTPPLYGGADCRGNGEDNQRCNEHTCPDPRPWLEWQPWSPCSVTCGGGTRSRSRKCDPDDSEQNNYEKKCIGEDTESEGCHDFPCLPVARSCGELQTWGLLDSVKAEIDPTGQGQAAWVYCDVTTDNKRAVTVIDHDKMERTLVDGYEAAGHYHLRLTYVITFQQIQALKDVSTKCRQFIKWECYSATIKNLFNGSPITFWSNSEGNFRHYWGGAPPDSAACACGVTGSCAKAGALCNCDANDEVWREDSGYIDFISDLPITYFWAGDTGGQGDGEQGYHTLGPLECW